jgi:cytoskeletal protein CcmA (bactofilin family)
MSSIFGGRRASPQPGAAESKAETIIGPTTSIHGDLKADGTLRVDGLVEGTIEAAGNVIIGQTGRVTASIQGQNVLIAGVVRGDVVAAQRLEIVATGKVWGDITVRALLIEEGGLFRGQSIMRDEAAPDALPEPARLDPGSERAPAPST